MTKEQNKRASGQYAQKTKYHVGQVVNINTGGETSRGTIDDQVYSHQDNKGNLIYKTVPKGYYWNDAYRIRFENGTTQYIPSEYISEETETNEYVMCRECQMTYLPNQLTDGLCSLCQKRHKEGHTL